MEKKQVSPWFRVLALCTALGVGGAIVGSQQKHASTQLEKPEVELSPAPPAADQVQADRMLMHSSKSGVIIPPEVYELKQEEPPPKERVLLPSSKSITMPVFRSRLAPASKPETDEP